MIRKAALGIAVLLVMAACGGGDGDTATTAPGTSTTTTTTGSDGTGGGGGDGADDGNGGSSGPGADSDFCLLLDDIEEEQDLVFDLAADALEETMNRTLELADQAAGLAPSQLEDAVNTLFSGFEGFVDALADINYDPFTNQAALLEDPRFVYLDSAEYNAAGTAIDDYCGDNPTTSVGPPTTIPGGTVPPAGGSGEIPDAYPDDLVPPGVTNVESVGFGSAFSVTFTTDESFDDVVTFFTDAFGPPASNIDAGATKIAQWIPEAPYTTIIITQDDDGVVMAFVAVTG